ncbi:uncharacterized protein LOC114932368 [Nylanderia fulva]|uniref:uncharacterized protein LOC114932368 n=1 Tax=Nylanderia fulva TaxID=613905 RepID=UPI0010FB24E5|nr:uncharacterized protein LOC114932368 [Nylanderia fulva]XP_029160368.1 uncharacterized protein LOC114932368 [Nylanderia fulva]XP_029160369.1 uncharacterized protein LOC114932368 [Nylanderia fulva]
MDLGTEYWIPCDRFTEPRPKSPASATFPQSATVSEGESVTFTYRTDIAPLKVTVLKDNKAVPETSSRYHFNLNDNTSFEFVIETCTANDVVRSNKRNETNSTTSAMATVKTILVPELIIISV